MSGQRVQKGTNYYAAPGAKTTRRARTVYLGEFEVYTRYSTTRTATLLRDTVHIQGADLKKALVETEVNGEVTTETTLYQLGNHIGSVVLELDDSTRLFRMKEYNPYGESNYFAVAVHNAAPIKYRNMAKERDFEETGFSYYRLLVLRYLV
jgi:hypothetical protein